MKNELLLQVLKPPVTCTAVYSPTTLSELEGFSQCAETTMRPLGLASATALPYLIQAL